MPGHVFIVRGDLTAIECDAWLLPTDIWCNLEPNWAASATGPARHDLIDGALDREPPAGWGVEGVRTQRVGDWWDDDGPVTWATLVGGHRMPVGWFPEGVEQFVDAAVADLRERGAPPRNRRSKYLLAVPLVGTRAGGASNRKGDIVAALLATLEDLAAVNDVDIVLTTWTSEAFAAAQGVRKRQAAEAGGSEVWPALDAELVDLCERLGRRAIEGDLVLFLGAGVSAAAGLPLWHELLRELARGVDLTDAEIEQLGRLNVLDQARLLEGRYERQDRSLAQRVVELVSGRRYALTHALLANLPSTEVVTVNYDELFERASGDAGYRTSVLPYDLVVANQRWLLKLHGSVQNPEDIVLTRSDYLAYADRRAALAGIVQALLITRHMLFVGFSLTDDNFNRIAEDVRRAVGNVTGTDGEPPLGTALLLHDDPMMQELWSRDLRSVHMAPPTDEIDPAAARRLEIFLDCLLTFASSNVAHLLDPTFDGLLEDHERQLKELLEHLEEEATPDLRSSPFWAPVAELLARYRGDTSAGSARSELNP